MKRILFLFDPKVKFSITKKTGCKGKDQQATTSSVVVQSDPEIENLEQQCYSDLLEYCKKKAAEVGVNYTTIMNLQVSCFLNYHLIK